MAVHGGATLQLDFAKAEKRARQAEQLYQAGEGEAAIRALWEAATLYRASIEAERLADIRPTPSPTDVGHGTEASVSRAEEKLSLKRESQREAATDGRVKQGTGSAERAIEPGVSNPATSPAAAPNRPTSASARPTPAVSDRDAILAVLQQLARAYERLDAREVLRVLPYKKIRSGAKMEEDFEQYDAIRMSINVVDLRFGEASGVPTATAHCRVSMSYDKKAGKDSTQNFETTYSFARQNGAWVATGERRD
jgi:hypothetical protein